jgi:hypothetical protein
MQEQLDFFKSRAAPDTGGDLSNLGLVFIIWGPDFQKANRVSPIDGLFNKRVSSNFHTPKPPYSTLPFSKTSAIN